MTYALAIYILSLFIAFLSPKFDPAAEDDYDDGKFLFVDSLHHSFTDTVHISIDTVHISIDNPFIYPLIHFIYPSYIH